MSDSDQDNHKPRICVVAHAAYNLLSGRTDLQHIGGAEVQIVTLARALVDIGFPLSFVTWDHGQPDGEQQGGMSVFKSYDPAKGLPFLRFVHPRWTRLNAALSRADADFYLQPCADTVTGQVAIWCRRHRRRFAFVVMSDEDCMPGIPRLRTRRERYLSCYGREHADCIIAQTHHQERLLRKVTSSQVAVVRPCGGSQDESRQMAEYTDRRPRILWLGRFSREKRIEWLLDLARICPEYDFDVLGGSNSGDSYAQDISREANGMPNVHLHGLVPHSKIGGYYSRAHALVLTSRYEGFPTVFLEAWSYGVPTVSTVDVDGIIAEARLGAVGATVPELARALQQLLGARDRWESCSRRAREYHREHHTPRATASAVAALLETLGGRGEDDRLRDKRACFQDASA